MSEPLFPAFLKLAGRRVLLVGAGPVGWTKYQALRDAGARVKVVAPAVCPAFVEARVRVIRRAFRDADLRGAWWVVSAAPAEVNRRVAAAAEKRRIFVNAVDHPSAGSAYLGGVVRKGGVTLAVSTDGAAPALAGLVREGLEALLPGELADWTETASSARAGWRAAGVPIHERRPLLLRALNALYERRGDDRAQRRPGFVSLVGAGPGDPGLLTVRALERLRSADLVLYDALVPPEVLALAPRAHRFFVGKRARRKSVEQETIHRLMIRAARRGKQVVRLKCGDPVVLGRGGEEALALAEAGISFELVPGVTSAIAAPELAGIPVTHRGLASGFAVISGHAETAWEPLVSSLSPHALTLVVLMGVATRARLAEALLARGWRPTTPVAVLYGASTAKHREWVGTLEALRVPTEPEGEDAPGTLVIGEVVSLAHALRAPRPARRPEVGGVVDGRR